MFRSLHPAHVVVQNIGIFCIASAMAGQYCLAQELPPTPEPQTASPQSHEQITFVAAKTEGAYTASISTSLVSSAEYVAARPAPDRKTVDSSFFLINSLHLGMAVLDVELTQRCITNHKCHEVNPLMPSSHAGQLSIGIGYAALGSFSSYWLKKHKSPHWWLPPVVGVAGHAVGIATGLSH